MTRQYTVEENGVIWYEENGFRISFTADPANSDYQRYLNPEAEQSTPIVTDEAEVK
jgi:hypothetical protein